MISTAQQKDLDYIAGRRPHDGGRQSDWYDMIRNCMATCIPGAVVPIRIFRLENYWNRWDDLPLCDYDPEDGCIFEASGRSSMGGPMHMGLHDHVVIIQYKGLLNCYAYGRSVAHVVDALVSKPHGYRLPIWEAMTAEGQIIMISTEDV